MASFGQFSPEWAMARYRFTNDYSEGAHPSILEALSSTNLAQQEAYGYDEYSDEARELIRGHMGGADPAIWFVPSGTIANTLCILGALRPHAAVVAPSSGHIAGPEAGAVEATGHKVVAVPPVDGKLTPDSIEAALEEHSLYPHMVVPRMVYVSNATEVGTVYTKAELTAISSLCRDRGLLLLLDGARLGAALASPRNDLSLADIAGLADAFWIGGTKAGALLGEAVVVPNAALAADFEVLVKQRGAMLAKGRILGLQFRELFRDRLFFELAERANAMAARLADGLRAKGVGFSAEPETNQLFPLLDGGRIERLQGEFDFYVWGAAGGDLSVVRLVVSWATPEKAVDDFVAAL